MRERLRAVLLATAVACVCLPATAFAQTGNIAGTVRDVQGGVMPGVTVEVTSPQLIEKTRSAVTDANGRYQITRLPVGVYKVTFSLNGFSTQERSNIELTTDFTAPINAEMTVGQRTEVVTVVARATMVDVQNARQIQWFGGDQPTLYTTHTLRVRRGDRWTQFTWNEPLGPRSAEHVKEFALAGKRIRALVKRNLTNARIRPDCL